MNTDNLSLGERGIIEDWKYGPQNNNKTNNITDVPRWED